MSGGYAVEGGTTCWSPAVIGGEMRRLILAAALVAGLTACTHASPAPSGSSPPGVAPVRVQSIVACPAPAPVETSERFYYPPWFPRSDHLPPDPDRCFPTAVGAVQA